MYVRVRSPTAKVGTSAVEGTLQTHDKSWRKSGGMQNLAEPYTVGVMS